MTAAAFLDLAAMFQLRFRLICAATAELKDICYQLRHDAYCEEFGFEPVREDGRETDEWDAESIHCLLQDVHTGQYAGCLRLIMPPRKHPSKLLPFERVCAGAIHRAVVNPKHLPRTSIAEVSRLVVRPDFRQASPLGLTRGALISSVLTGLSHGLRIFAFRHGLHTLFLLVEPRFARYLRMLGIRAHVIGDAVDHRGRRVPVMVEVHRPFESPRISSGVSFIPDRKSVLSADELHDRMAADALPQFALRAA